MQGCTPEWRTHFQREEPTRDPEIGQLYVDNVEVTKASIRTNILRQEFLISIILKTKHH